MKTALMTVVMFSGKKTDQRTKRTVTEADTQNTKGSKGLVESIFCATKILLLKKMMFSGYFAEYIPGAGFFDIFIQTI